MTGNTPETREDAPGTPNTPRVGASASGHDPAVEAWETIAAGNPRTSARWLHRPQPIMVTHKDRETGETWHVLRHVCPTCERAAPCPTSLVLGDDS